MGVPSNFVPVIPIPRLDKPPFVSSNFARLISNFNNSVLVAKMSTHVTTCRTCFAMCTDNANDSHKCFGGLNGNDANADQFLYPAFGSSAGELRSGTVSLGQAG